LLAARGWLVRRAHSGCSGNIIRIGFKLPEKTASLALDDDWTPATPDFGFSLDADGRLEQLCNLEAMAQIARAYPDLRPDRVIAYARADTTTKDDLLSAAGAAFHSGRDWINLSFTCRASRDRTTMIAFEFEVGEPIPRSDWTALNLPARP